MKYLLLFLLIFFIGLIAQNRWILLMQTRKMGQNIKDYGPKGHVIKAGTPSMGGVPFLLVAFLGAILGTLAGFGSWIELLKLWSYPLLAAFVGFVDDWLKYTSKSSEGLTSYQKFGAQLLITLPWAMLYSRGGLTFLPGFVLSPTVAAIVLTILGVGILNAVNVTDGLDGLATGAMCISLGAAYFLIRGSSVMLSVIVLLGALLAFLWDNSNPARVFMGDVGAHFLGAFLINLCVHSGQLGLVFPLAFLFGIELITVAIQIIAIRGFSRKVFLMSPLHHHFEILGWSEVRIVVRFWILHLVGILTTLTLLRFIFVA